MKKIFIGLLLLGLFFSPVLALDSVKMGGKISYQYMSVQNNILHAYDRTNRADYQGRLIGNYNADNMIDLRADLNSDTSFYLLTFFETYFYLREYYLVWNSPQLKGLQAKVGLQDLPIAQFFNHTITWPYAKQLYYNTEHGISLTYPFFDFTIEGSIFNNNISLVGIEPTQDAPLNETPAVGFNVRYKVPLVDDVIESLIFGASFFQDNPAKPIISGFTELKTLGFTADLELLRQESVGFMYYSEDEESTMPTSNLTSVSVGLAYHLLSNLELATRYERIIHSEKQPQIVTVGLNYGLSDSVSLQVEGTFPQYSNFNVQAPENRDNPNIKDTNYYIIGLTYRF